MGGLGGVNEDGGQFAGLVYAQGGGEEGALLGGELVDGLGGGGRSGGDGGVVGGGREVGGGGAGGGGRVRVGGGAVGSSLAWWG